MEAGTELVGRSTERELLSAALTAAAAGEPSAVVLHGEPGVGKTRLVTHATTADGGGGRHVLIARCLRFGTDGAAFLPVAQALGRWLDGPIAPELRATVLDGADDLAALMPGLGPPVGEVPGGRLMMLLSTVITRVAADAPIVLVADDLQWADPSTLDLLAYLISGFAPGQRLAILGTYRDTELQPGHVLHGWVADMRRMPGVTVQRLDPMDRIETAELVRRYAHDARMNPDDVFDRSGGNPYLTELIVADGDSGSGSLADALLAAWHRLTPSARETTQVLAVGGRSVPLPVLDDVMGRVVGDPHRSAQDLAEASAAGLVVLDGEEVWFRHPLLAEVVAATVDPLRATQIHDAYIEALDLSDNVPDLARHSLLALHHEAAGRATPAFAASLRAAQAAEDVFAMAEASEHLERACRLWDAVEPAVRDDTGDRASLLERTSVVAALSGRDDVAMATARRAVDEVDPAVEPLRLCRLLVALPLTCGLTWPEYTDDHADVRRAIDLAAPLGPSDELASALATLSLKKQWSGLDDGEEDAEAAVAMAEAVGTPATLGFAHLIRSQFHWGTPEGLEEAESGWNFLRAHGPPIWRMRATLYLNCVEGSGDIERLAAQGIEIYAEAMRMGTQVGVGVGLRSADTLVRLGRYAEARQVLRIVHTHRQSPDTTCDARAVATLLAVRTGEPDEAERHIRRIDELWGDRPTRGANGIRDARAEYAWAVEDWISALDEVRSEVARVWRMNADVAVEWLAIAARSAADLAESGRSAADRESAAGLFAAIEKLCPLADRGPVAATPMRVMFQAQLDAECSRLRAGADQVECWTIAKEAASDAAYPWHEAWAAFQLGRVLLRQHGRRPEAVAVLRTAHGIAEQIGARPLAERVATVAVQARISLQPDPQAASGPAVARTIVHGVRLTNRESEVLEHIVAGRTMPRSPRRSSSARRPSASTSPTCCGRRARAAASSSPRQRPALRPSHVSHPRASVTTLTGYDLAFAHELLLSARTETEERLAALRGEIAAIVAASESSNADDEHDPEGATIAFERARTDALARQAERGLADIDAALARLEDGSYGRCSVCGAPIPVERLRARPTATTDVEHA